MEERVKKLKQSGRKRERVTTHSIHKLAALGVTVLVKIHAVLQTHLQEIINFRKRLYLKLSETDWAIGCKMEECGI